ncbi:ATP-binding protein [Brevundimonas sp.]|uniref:AAA family ATPase n=1 Tax=Brevundimonas sp. TaxID=1871086 RepID=UPI002D5BC71A|nr:ATP-binding protein [Brevundimonas sp.]HYC99079.1 ATP-binding protein [Brevundimonas sp.]
MASAQQLIGLIKSHAEGDEARFFDLAIQLAAAEEQKGHKKLADQLRAWADAGRTPPPPATDRTPLLATPRGELAELIGASYPKTRLAELVLPHNLQDELRHIIVETRQRDRLEARGLHPRRRLLLAGPPGTGKTMTAAALAGELKLPMFSVLLHGLISKHFGETASKLRLIFDAIRTTRGVYLFDEIDALAGARTGGNDVGEARRILNSFLQFLEEDPGPSLLIATTNLPELLDSAILRRFDLVLRYEQPSDEHIVETVRRRLRSFDTTQVRWTEIAENARGLSPADLVRATEDAARRTVLSGADEISPTVLLESFERRRALQLIGTPNGSKKPPASPRPSQRGSSKVSTGSNRRRTTS